MLQCAAIFTAPGRNDSPAKEVFEESPWAVGPAPVCIHFHDYCWGLSWDFSAEATTVAVGDLKVEVEDINVEWLEIKWDFKVEPFEGHVEPGVKVAVQLNVWFKSEWSGLICLRGEVFCPSPVESGLNVEGSSSFPLIDKSNSWEGIGVFSYLNVAENVTVTEVKKLEGLSAVCLSDVAYNSGKRCDWKGVSLEKAVRNVLPLLHNKFVYN